VVDDVELVCVVGPADLGDELVQPRQRPAIDRQQLLDLHRVLLRVEVVEVAQGVAQRVADLAVALAELVEDLLRRPDVVAVVAGGDPQPAISAPCSLMTLSKGT
jgi:hypothetical protein